MVGSNIEGDGFGAGLLGELEVLHLEGSCIADETGVVIEHHPDCPRVQAIACTILLGVNEVYYPLLDLVGR